MICRLVFHFINQASEVLGLAPLDSLSPALYSANQSDFKGILLSYNLLRLSVRRS